MTNIILIAMLGIGNVAIVATEVLRRQRRRSPQDWLKEATHLPLVLHTTDDRSISGLVVRVEESGVLLRAAKLLGKDDVDLAGEVWVPRAHIAFAQHVGDQPAAV